MNTDRFKFRVWYQPACDGIESRYFYDVESIYDGSIDGLGWISCFGDLLNDDQYIIEQCTGLKDKNGNLIFEGDVLEVGINSMKCTMKYQDGCFWLDNGKSMYAIIIIMGSMEIIGNIHEEQRSEE